MHIESPLAPRKADAWPLFRLSRFLGRHALATLTVWLLALVTSLGQTTSEPKSEPKSAPGVRDKETAASAAVPGGGLEAHERAGGHLLSRHVGKSAEQLRQRLQSDSRISAASSFSDKKSAEAAVAAAIAANQKKIASWLKGQEERLVITYRSGNPVGISVGRNSGRARDVTGVRLILVRNPRFVGGWHILTGYPEA